MKHLIIITYAKIIQMIRKIIMSDEILMQLIFMPGINKLRNFNSLAKAYLEFHKAKRNVPAYKQFLKEKGFNKVSFKGFKPVISEIPEIDKENYINKYNLESRCEFGVLPKKGLVIDESSGSSGSPTNWVRGETERKINAKFIKFGIEKLFRKEPIFVINAFALGAWATGVNITISCLKFAKVKSVGPEIDKIENTLNQFGSKHKYLIMGYPPFLKMFVDKSNIDFNNYDISLIFGGEPMSEGMRKYLLKKGIKRIYSSYGASDLELNISSENPFTISLRGLINENQELKNRLVKFSGALPMIFQYNPSDFLIESNSDDELITTICRDGYVAPKIRYNIKDKGYSLKYNEIKKIIKELNLEDQIIWSKTDLPVLFHFGRSNMTVSFYGSNISPTDVQEVIYRLEKLSKNINSFFIETIEDDEGEKILKIMLEKNEDVSETIDEKKIKNEFFEVLTNINQDFKKAFSMLDDSEKTKLIFCDFNTDHFAKNDIRIKAKYIN